MEIEYIKMFRFDKYIRDKSLKKRHENKHTLEKKSMKNINFFKKNQLIVLGKKLGIVNM